jgi:hypothetical protein
MSIAACRPSVMTASRMSSPFWPLIVLEGRARLGGDQLALAAANTRQRDLAAQVRLLHHVRD